MLAALRAVVDHARAVLEEPRADGSPFTRWALQSAIDEYDRLRTPTAVRSDAGADDLDARREAKEGRMKSKP